MPRYPLLLTLPLVLAAFAAQAKVVHFHVVGDYRVKTVIVYQENGGQALVTDRIVFDFDYDQKADKLLGPVKIQNSKSTVADLQNVEKSCPAPKPRGDYEHLELQTVKETGGEQFELLGTRSFPAIDVIADCQGAWHKHSVAAKSEAVVEPFALVDLDAGTFTFKADNGWTWTSTASPVSP